MAKKRTEIWIGLIVLFVLFIPIAIAGLWVFMSVTAKALHPNPQQVQSVTLAPPAAGWMSAVEQSRPLVRAHLSEHNLPGLSVAVGVGGKLVWAEGFGLADLERGTPVTPTTRFNIGTASISLTAAAVGLLLEEGRLKLDDQIHTYVPEMPEKQRAVTLRQLMGQVSGLPNDGGDESPLYTRHCDRAADAFQYFSGYERALRFEPGSEWRSSNYGWIAVSAAVEAVTGEPLSRFMWTRVFEPIGMHDTEVDSTTDPVPNRTTSYFPRFAADPRYGPERHAPA